MPSGGLGLTGFVATFALLRDDPRKARMMSPIALLIGLRGAGVRDPGHTPLGEGSVRSKRGAHAKPAPASLRAPVHCPTLELVRRPGRSRSLRDREGRSRGPR